ncbi:MAG: ABC transporter ATP-binding protein [Planctomycetota bacterium]
MSPVLQIEGLGKDFGDRTVVTHADLELARGELLGFVGPNGAGKSTCLRVLVGVLPRDRGKVRVLGLDPATDSLAIRHRCSYLPGETSVYASMTGREYLDFALSFHQGTRRLSHESAAMFDLPLQRRVRTYSAGMKQKLALLAALQPDVELYVLDEPDRALDASARLVLRELIRDLGKEGRSVLLSSHHLSEVEALTDRSVFLFEGRTVDPDRVRHARELLRAEIRLHLRRDIEWPEGVESRRRDEDGTWRLRVRGDPLSYLARLPSDAVDRIEVGSVRLEDLYRVLSEPTEGSA